MSQLETGIKRLYQAVNSIYPISPDEFEPIVTGCRLATFARSQPLFRAGELADSVFFILQGLVRFYYVTADGKESTKSFAAENQFAGVVGGISQTASAGFYIEALEPVIALSMPVVELEALYRNSIAWANIGRLHAESMAQRKER